MICFCLINIGVYADVAYTILVLYIMDRNTSLGFAVKHYTEQKKQ